MVDSEILMALLKKKGFSFTEDLRFARVFIINTCAFIESAKQESIDAILEAASFKEKKSDNGKLLIVTGCLSQRYPNELRKEIPQIDAVFGTSDFVKIPQFICHSEARRAEESNKILRRHGVYPERSRRGTPQNDISVQFVSETPRFLYNHKFNRAFITPPHYAYIKLQEGCMNNCSYCVIPKLRGPYRSRDFDSVIKEVELLKKTKNIKEINLIGQDTTLYGIDKYGKVRLAELLKKLAKIMKNGWIRLLYAHPAHYSDELINIIS
ncbi:MAG: radical SAM protein, partial [Candidatus Omnitrophica bacterium]|nr:radical SAM protein [Candidatus Omnitrophota bacterium]